MALVQRTINQCDVCGHEWIPRSAGERCGNRDCRSTKWNASASPLTQQLEASLAATPEVQDKPLDDRKALALVAMADASKRAAPLEAEPVVICGQRSEPDWETGEVYTCGKAPHTGKVTHGNWRKA